MVDTVLLVVDVVEGGMLLGTEQLLKLTSGKQIVLFLNKIDRLCLELRLTPLDAYNRVKQVIEQLNTLVGRVIFRPELGNVLFGSAEGNWSFSLASWAHYWLSSAKRAPLAQLHPDEVAIRLWGSISFDRDTRQFQRLQPGQRPSAVTCIFEPLWKMLRLQLEEPVAKPSKQNAPTPPFICLNPYSKVKLHAPAWHPWMPLVDVLSSNTEYCLPVRVKDEVGCDPRPLLQSDSFLGWVSKWYAADQALVQMWRGSLEAGQSIWLYSSEHTATRPVLTAASIKSMVIPNQGTVEVLSVAMWALVRLEVQDANMLSPFMTISSDPKLSSCLLPPPSTNLLSAPRLRMACEPIHLKDHDRLRGEFMTVLPLCWPSSPLHYTDNSSSWEVHACGELAMDSLMHTLNQAMEMRVSEQPWVDLRETVEGDSRLLCHSTTANGQLRVTVMATGMERKLTEALSTTLPSPAKDPQGLINALIGSPWGWERLAAQSVMAVDSDCILMDETMAGGEDQLVAMLRDALIQGFSWACREGPLVGAPLRGVILRITSISCQSPTLPSFAQVVPAMRRACLAAFLSASPRLMEPLVSWEALAAADVSSVIYELVGRRRGHVLTQDPIGATPLTRLVAQLPLLDTPGLETDCRVATQGAAHCQQQCIGWQLVPGDPLDHSLKPLPLQPSPPPLLARELLLRGRRRRGWPAEVPMARYFEPEQLAELLE